MRKDVMVAALVAMLCLVIVNRSSAAPAGGKKSEIARGEYLVKSIGQCGDCHTPFNSMGGFVTDKWLQGKKLDFRPLVPIPIWADTSPNIAGLPGWDSDNAVQFFMTGLAPNGQPARRCRLTR